MIIVVYITSFSGGRAGGNVSEAIMVLTIILCLKVPLYAIVWKRMLDML